MLKRVLQVIRFIILIHLIGYTSHINASVVLETFRVSDVPRVGCPTCVNEFYVTVTETNTTVNSDFSAVYVTTPGVSITYFEYVNPVLLTSYTNVINMNIQFRQGVYPVVDLVVLSQEVNNTIQVPVGFQCSMPPPQVSIKKQTMLRRLSSQYSALAMQLDYDLSVFSLMYSNYVSRVCYTYSPLYKCDINMIYRGDHELYIITFETITTSPLINATSNYSAPIDIYISILYPCITYNFTMQMDPDLPQNDHLTTKVNSIDIPVYYPYNSSLPGEYPNSLLYFNMSNVNSILCSINGYPIIPVLGNKEQSTHILISTSTGNSYIPIYQINGNISVISQIVTYFSTVSYTYITLQTNQSFFGLTNKLSVDLFGKLQQVAVIPEISFTKSPIPQFPFGYSKLANETNVWFQITFAGYYVPPYLNQMYISFYYTYARSTFFVNRTIPPAPVDINPPVLESLQMYTHLSSVYLVARISDDVSGLNTVYIYSANQLAMMVLIDHKSSSFLVDGNKNNGTYLIELNLNEKAYPAPYSYAYITLHDEVNNYKFYNSFYLDNGAISFPNLKPDPIYSYEAWNITYFKIFPSNNIDTSDGPVNASILFNLTTINSDYEPHFGILMDEIVFNGHIKNLDVYGRWDYTDRVYRTDFQLPARMPNITLLYYLDTALFWGSPFLIGYGLDAELNVWSRYMDSMPPIVESLALSPPLFVSTPNTFTIEYNITIVDQPNGLKDGYISIVSTADMNPYTFNFNSTYLIDGDIYRGTYRFVIPLNGSLLVNQTFFISEMVLTDNSGVQSIHPTNDSTTVIINPLHKVLYSQITNITIETTNIITDLVKPTISDFSIQPQTIDIGSLNRTVTFTLAVTDDNSGISLRHDPNIYLMEYSGDIITVKPYSRILAPPFVTYYYETTIPLMFGYENITVSVYGIVDNQLNMNGYSTNQLKDISMPSIIPTTCTTDQPIITNSSRVYQHGGIVTLYGFGFGDNSQNDLELQVDYRDGNGYITQNIVKSIHRVLRVHLDIVLKPFIKVQLKRGTKLSNEYIIYRTNYYDTLINTPQPISCPSQCNGHGNCTVNGCVCNDPWSGPDCSSKPIIIPTPTTNTTDPVIIIDTGNGTSSTTASNSGSSSTGGNNGGGGFEFKTIIAIYSIRELSISGDKVKEYFPSNWTFTNQTNNLTTSDGSISKYHYSTQLNNTSTLFNVTIQYFINQSTIQFAGQPITLSPYSTKMSLDLTSYPFQSTLNTLQIIFNVEFISKKGGECLDKQFGLGNGNDLNDLQWMKLNIDDKSLYGNFIRRGVVDGRNIAIKNSLLDSQFIGNGDESQSFIGINVPQYFETVYLDPDFSHLIDIDGNSQSSNRCIQPSSSPKSKIGMIVGIVVGGVIAIAILITSVIYFKKRIIRKRESKKMDAKLKRMSKEMATLSSMSVSKSIAKQNATGQQLTATNQLQTVNKAQLLDLTAVGQILGLPLNLDIHL